MFLILLIILFSSACRMKRGELVFFLLSGFHALAAQQCRAAVEFLGLWCEPCFEEDKAS